MSPRDPYGNDGYGDDGSGYGPDGYNERGFNAQGQYDPTYDQNSDYYIERGDTSNTSEEVQQEAEATADTQEAGGGWLDELIDRLTRQGRVDQAYDQQLTGQAAELAIGIETRQPPALMSANYLSVTHPELKRMVTEEVDSSQVRSMGDMWIEAGNAMTEFQTSVATAINNSETDWQGQAGNSARKFMADVGNWVGTAGQSAQLAGTQTNIQADALDEAKRAMPDPVEFDPAAANEDLRSTSDPLELIDKYNNYLDQYNAKQEAHEQAAEVVSTYDTGLGGASTMPAFATPPTMNESSGESNGVDSTGIDTLRRDPSTNPNGTTGDIPSGSTNPGGPGNPTAPTPPPSGPTGPNGPGDSGWTPPGSTSPSGGPDFPVVPTPLPNPNPNPNPNPAYPPGTPLPVGLGQGFSSTDLDRRPTPSGRFGGAPSFGPGGGPSSGLTPRSMTGLGPGGMPGALAAENAGLRGGAPGGAFGGGGMAGRGGMMGGTGAGRGQGEDDDEHQRPSFLVEGDPDEVFGTSQITAPPVIGE